MTSPTNKRPRYFDGQYLQDVDFVSEQNYHLDRQRRLPSLLTVSGIAGGLEWLSPEIQPGETPTDELTIAIAPGTAIDADGRQIVLLAERRIDLPENLSGEQILYLAYHQQDSEDANDKQGESSTRTSEDPLLGFVTPAEHDAATQIALAKLDLKDKVVQQLDLSIREYSGIYLPSSAPAKSGPSLRSGGDSNPKLAVLDGDFSLKGTLTVSSSSTISGNSTLMGNVGIGLEPSTAKLTVGGDTAIVGMTRVVDSDRAVLELTKAVSGSHGRHAYLVSRSNAANEFATDLGFRVRNSLQSWQVDDIADALTIFHNGNVGIGTDTPDAKLEVAGSLAVTGTSRLSGNVGIGAAPGSEQLKVDGDATVTGNLLIAKELTVEDAIYAKNSDIYFTNPDHNYTATAEKLGHAGIENSKDYNSLMIIGRKTQIGSGSRRVRLWDYLQVSGNLDVTSELKVSGDLEANSSLTVSGNIVANDSLSIKNNLTVGKAIYAGNSELYFTDTNHDHTGYGNRNGFAAIENTKSHDALMILGRQTAEGRKVAIWDTLRVNGRLSVSSHLTVEGAFFVGYLPERNKKNVQWDAGTHQLCHDNSSRRSKRNIMSLEDEFSKILEVKPKTYTRPSAPDDWEIGYIAEDFHELGLNRLVFYEENGYPEAINYPKICMYLIEVVKQLQLRFDALMS